MPSNVKVDKLSLNIKLRSIDDDQNDNEPKKKPFCHHKHGFAMVFQTTTLLAMLLNVFLLLAQKGAQVAGLLQQPMHRSPMMLVPPSGGASSLQHLAKSPASALLASNFFEFERTRLLQQQQNGPPHGLVQRQAGAASVISPTSQLASELPTYSGSLDGSLRLDEYHSLEDIYNFIDDLPKQYRHIQVFTIGHTTENRPIKAMEIINNSTDSDFIWLDALTHAREWITGTTMLYIIDQLVSGKERFSSASMPMVYRKNYIIIPVVNPDGYVYTWTTNRMWRKNRSRSRTRSPDSKCVGADLNRNFDHTFGGEGASMDPCSHIYAGAFPFSEPETKSMADLLWSLKDRVKFYLTIHSFNQLWACPYAHTTGPSASLQKHMKVLRSIQQAVYNTEGELYEIGPLSTKLYVGSGFGIDFAYDKCGIEHSYLVELRDKGANGFVLPPDQIMPTARETFAGLQAGIKSVFGGLR